MSGFYSPTVFAALPRLVAAWKAWPDLAGVVIKNGPEAADSQAMEVLAAGWSGPAAGDQGDADGTFAREGMGPQDRESYSIRNALAVKNADGDIAACEARAAVIWTAAYAAVYADHTLGGLVLKASAGSWSMTQDLSNSGVVVAITFDIAIDAYTQSP